MVRVIVGPGQHEFAVHKDLLHGTSDFFRESIDAIPAPLATKTSAGRGDPTESESTTSGALWLSSECPEMFDLFVLWLYRRKSFPTLINDAILGSGTAAAFSVPPLGVDESYHQNLHWKLVRLHVFAAQVGLPVLQDLAMDAIQDLYLRCDWDISPDVVRFLYAECERAPAFRIRKWAVAMIAWMLSNGSGLDGSAASPFHDLFGNYPELFEDYITHAEKTTACRANIRIKNPQLRIPGNDLMGEERHFGFRQCSFHSHRKAVGQGVCPHAFQQPALASPPSSVSVKRMSRMFESDAVSSYFKLFSSQGIPSPVSDPLVTPSLRSYTPPLLSLKSRFSVLGYS